MSAPETPRPLLPLVPGSVRVTPGPAGTTDVCASVTKVMAELPGIGKDDRSPEGYQYRGIEAITKHLQPLLAKHGVFIMPEGEITKVVPSPAMKDGWQDVYMKVTWTIVGADGSTLTAQTNGIGRDRTDKGSNKAQTQAFKYLLMHVLCIADGKDDSDGLTYEHGQTADSEMLWAREGKTSVLAACGGDKTAAATAWTAAGLDGRKRVTLAELETALSQIDLLEVDKGTTEEGAGSTEPDPTATPAPPDVVAEYQHEANQLGEVQAAALAVWLNTEDIDPAGGMTRAQAVAAIEKARELRSRTGPINTGLVPNPAEAARLDEAHHQATDGES